MDTIFTLGDEEVGNTKINLDDLYERKKQSDLNTLKVYNKILTRIHTKIKHQARINPNDQHCWYVVPEMIIGVPKYDHGACTAYIIDKLRENGFVIRYTHPNLIFISWQTWTPTYVRDEIRKKTGMQFDGWGNQKTPKNQEDDASSNGFDKNDPNSLILGRKTKNISVTKTNKDYRPIDTYKPTGNLIYNKELLERIQDKSK
uniref:Uncharacterized protein n=1 Tax=viral metagenome TaxID=1070528 RepID=A0A6C0LI82_9ZZZZ